MSTAIPLKSMVPLAKTTEILEGTMKEFKVGQHEVFVARVGNKFYAAENVCPHMGAKLSQGTLEGTVVTCPRHASKFDLTDGRVIRWTDWAGMRASLGKLFRSPRPLITYPVKVEKDSIIIEV